jgi:Domain of unknown function (DUF3883)
MKKPILFLNVAWMRAYRGVTIDTPEGKFGFLHEGHGKPPHEVLNFLPQGGQYYGYAPVKNGTITITRLGAKPDDDFIDNVLVVWTATQPGVGSTIVGWYDGARVFAESQKRPETRATRAVDRPLWFNVIAPVSPACRLLHIDERVFPVPRSKKGFPGIASSFFPEGTSPKKWVESVGCYISSGEVETVTTSKRKGGGGWASDPEHRADVERAAVKRVTAHYRKLKYILTCREAENCGWDWDACRGRLTLRLEVKGLSGDAPIVEVTPNEYTTMISRLRRASYRICIVTNALDAKRSKLRIFAYDVDRKAWISDDPEVLSIVERTAACLSVQVPPR